jgi:hypothetical protein
MPNEHVGEAAARIAGGPPPQWLTIGLPGFIASIAATIRSDEGHPEPPPRELKARLQEIAKAARLIQDELHKTEVHNALYQDAFDSIGSSLDAELVMHGCLRDLVDRAEAAAQDVPVKKGRPKDRAPLKPMIAHMVRLLWHHVRHAWPSSDNEDAARACRAIWRGAGGAPGWADEESLRVWRDHLKAAEAWQDKASARSLLRSFFRTEFQPDPARQKRWY